MNNDPYTPSLLVAGKCSYLSYSYSTPLDMIGGHARWPVILLVLKILGLGISILRPLFSANGLVGVIQTAISTTTSTLNDTNLEAGKLIFCIPKVFDRRHG